ncbi:MAG: AAA family ATPase [Oscillatoria sp. SIO1A7]|nr:AAA family ATPase [Oscillatoria sp. SIO1A7]
MNGAINGYQLIEAIHNGTKTVIYRGKRESASGEAIVKTLKAEYPTLEEIARLRHEYQILDSLDLPGTIKPLALENYGNGIAIVLEEFGSGSLEKYLAREKLSLVEFLKIAIKLVEILGEVHQCHVIHKDIKPHNILIDAVTGQIKLIDFSIATRLSRETQSISNPDLLEGTLAYMAPEQTGRMNRSIDYRTDFYCLGVTFYEMLTGQLPFTTTDPMELVHCHIAQIPLPPQEVNPEIPPAISEIVMKLVAKNAEDRYQSAPGIKADLEECLFQWQTLGTIENLIPGERDKSGQFLIPQKLYGREAEVAELMAAFDRASSGVAEMMLVSGYSGVGKTAVINEVHKPIVRQRGYFIAGKFDLLGRNVPYAALLQAFRELVRQLLTESSEQIANWKEQLLAALGENARVIIDTIPEVELIIGSAPEVPELPATESQNRFNRTFKQFVRVFTKQEHPLVLFLDDLQWADLASLKLIELLVADSDTQYLLFIGAYRDNEVSPTHPAIQTIEKIQSAGAAVNNIVLAPLDQKNVSLLVADTLQESERSQELSELLFNKTQGNPFFLTQLLNTLHQEKLILFDFTEGRWLWDIDRIQSIGIADYTVVELVARNIKKLPAQTQERLKQAACTGNIFHLDVLAVVNGESLVTTADYLWEALQAGLILPLNNAYKISLAVESKQEEEGLNFSEIRVSYKFLHDRVQQAAYSLIPESEKKATHLKIGRLLLDKTSEYALNDNLFDIVNQLNIGVEFITEAAERERLASLNLMAGKKAKGAAAYDAASGYLEMGLELLPAASWESHYELTRDLHVEALEATYLTTNFSRAQHLSEIVLERTQTKLEKIKVYELKIPYYLSQNQLQAAIDTALQALEKLGVYLPKKTNNLAVVLGLINTKIALRNKKVEDLAALPEMTDLYKVAALRILMNLIPAAFNANPMLFPLIVFKMVGLSVKYGNSSLSAYGYCMYGMLLCSVLADTENGYQFGKLALRIMDEFDARELKAKVYFLFNVFERHGKEHVLATAEPLVEAFQSGMETGDIEYACFSAVNYCYYLFWSGEHIDYVANSLEKYSKVIQKYRYQVIRDLANICNDFVLSLKECGDDNNIIYNKDAEEEMVDVLIRANNNTGMGLLYVTKLIIYYLFKDCYLALKNAIEAEQYKQSIIGSMHFVQHNFYYSLTLLACYPNAVKKKQKQYLKKVCQNQKQMKKWATHAPCNFQHKYELVEAEKARVLGEETTAMALYDRAIAGAKENRFVQEEALANELAAEFHLARGSEKIAKTYMTEAYYGYIRWGAKAKVRDLDERHPNLISRSERADSQGSSLSTTVTNTSTTGANAKILDLATVVKASQAISGEIIPSSLLKKMMTIVIENAGARSGCLLVKHEGEWVAEASGTVAGDEVTVEQSSSSSNEVAFPLALINYADRTRKTLVIDNASDFDNNKSNGDSLSPASIQNDPYIQAKQPKSILCLPIVHHGKLSGILYLENDLIVGAFTKGRVEILNLLSSQISISIENARLYAREQEKSQQLAESLEKLQQTQAQLVHTEKISSLGQLVAGVAHEVNNPVSFISGNVYYSREYVEKLLEYLELHQKHYPNPPEEIVEMAEEIDLEFICEDLLKMLGSMQLGTDRIKDIMQSLRNFSREDKGEKKPADIHAGIESTLMILGHRLKPQPERPEIKVVKEYGSLPEVICFSGQLNQVFMNLMANSIDAMEEAISSGAWEKLHGDGGSELSAPTIRIGTEVRGCRVAISIADNGPGMPEEVRSKLFKAFFTTKPEGKGTGLGLSISYQIVTEKHGGTLKCKSAPGQGAEFIIEIPINEEF